MASTTPPCSLKGQSCGALLPFLPTPPTSSSAAAVPAHLAAGRGAPLLGAPGRLSRMLRGREPCSCHGRSSLWGCLPLHQGLKPAREAPPTGPTHRRFRFLFPASLSGLLFRLLWLSLEKVVSLRLTPAPALIGTSASWGSGSASNLLARVWDGHLRTWCPRLSCGHLRPTSRQPAGWDARAALTLRVSESSWSGLRLAWSLRPLKKLLPARVLPAQDPKALAISVHLGAQRPSPESRRGRRPPPEPRSPTRGPLPLVTRPGLGLGFPGSGGLTAEASKEA